MGGTPSYVEMLGGVGEGGCRLWGWSAGAGGTGN